MLIKGGYLQKIARINLSTQKMNVENVDEDFAVSYIGGRGWGARILFDELKGKTDAFSPENKIVIATGPLSGALVPAAGKISFNTISPATGIYADSNMGGDFAVFLKKSGFDALIIEGIAEKPSYILSMDGELEVRDAAHLWGLRTMEAEETLRKELGKNSRVAVIGPAGENLVKISCVQSDFGRQAGRCGIGAVMGSKKLKAVAVKGDAAIPIADEPDLKKVYKECGVYMAKHPDLKLWQRQGTMMLIEWANEANCLPTRNFREVQYEYFKEIGGEKMEKTTRVGNKACYLCPMRCGQVNRAGGVEVEGPEYETASMIGSNCALSKLEEVIRANYLCDQLGLDTISAGNIAAFAMECYEKGFITREDAQGLDLKFGNAEALYTFFERIAYRRGIGNLFAEGVKAASQEIGHDSKKFAMHVKGLELTGYDVRAAPAMALAYATADIGAHHNRAWAITYDLKTDRKSYSDDKVDWVIYLQHIRPLFDCLGVCRLQWLELNVNPEFYVRFYEAATGVKTNIKSLLQKSEAVWNLTRLINLRQGLQTDSDWLPDRVFDDPIPAGPLKGIALDRDAFKGMIKKYYKRRGWDESGVPQKEKLKELKLYTEH